MSPRRAGRRLVEGWTSRDLYRETVHQLEKHDTRCNNNEGLGPTPARGFTKGKGKYLNEHFLC